MELNSLAEEQGNTPHSPDVVSADHDPLEAASKPSEKRSRKAPESKRRRKQPAKERKPKQTPLTSNERQRRFRERRKAEMNLLRFMRVTGSNDDAIMQFTLEKQAKSKKNNSKRKPVPTKKDCTENEASLEEKIPDSNDTQFSGEDKAVDESRESVVDETMEEPHFDEPCPSPEIVPSPSLVMSEFDSVQLGDAIKAEPLDIDEEFWVDSPYSNWTRSESPTSDVECIQEKDIFGFTADIPIAQEPTVTDVDPTDDLTERDAEETAGLPRCECCGEIELYSTSSHNSSLPVHHTSSVPNNISGKASIGRDYLDYIECPQCPAKFRSEELWKAHVNKHNGIKSLQCRKEGCEARFWDVQGRCSHEKRCGRTVQQECNICGKLVRSMNALKTHLTEVHEQSPYLCDFCGTGFKYKHHLEDHRRSLHLRIRFECDICRKQFKSEFYMRRHRKHIHGR